MSNNRYYRKSTSITISNFYEQYALEKYNFDPPYQRDYNVWDEEQKAFLLDTVFKNFPIPPIFLEQKIDSDTGKTLYDVIDGKQRLSAIVGFIKDEFALPKDFGNDIYGNAKINGKRFSEIKELAKSDNEVRELIADFWAYAFSIEYIDNPDEKIVDSIFDRLNREGCRLNSQELRKAQYYDTLLYNDIVSFRNDKFISHLVAKLNKDRLEDVGFITELFIFILQGDIADGNEEEIDAIFKKYTEFYDEKKSKEICTKFDQVKEKLESWHLDLKKYSIEGVSHLYALWYIAWYVLENEINDENIVTKLNAFYSDLRSEHEIPETNIYQKSMSSASRSKTARRKRVNSILKYLGVCGTDDKK